MHRYEVISTDLGVLEELDIVLIGIDRPSYGWSDSDADRQALGLPARPALVVGLYRLGFHRACVAASCHHGSYDDIANKANIWKPARTAVQVRSGLGHHVLPEDPAWSTQCR